MTRLYLHNLGCAKQQVEGELIRGWGRQGGIQFIEDASQAEVIIINTCAFIREAQEEAVQAILEAAQMKTAGSCRQLLVFGCFPQRFKDELASELPEVDGFFGVRHWRDLLRRIGVNGSSVQAANPFVLRDLETPPHYAYLRIADGCNRGCSYCVIPTIRGPYVSRRPEDILEEAEHLARRGVKELLPVAQELNSYGHDLGLGQGNGPLMRLLESLCQIEGIEWIRPLYLHPPVCDEELLAFWSSQPKLCRYLDLPIEHASERILKTMGRGSSRRQLVTLFESAQVCMPDVALRTSIIVGFPGETEEEFEELLDFVRQIRFHHLGSFEYSSENGTAAARLPNPIPAEIKRERRERLMELQMQISHEHKLERVGSIEEVLVDSFEAESGFSIAHGRREAPEIDGHVLIKGNLPPGSKLRVQIEEALEYDLVARPLGRAREEDL
ncbi:MAG TPA: 30S ribosomal protein S12 methylthiotransferase RimO [bacterium]